MKEPVPFIIFEDTVIRLERTIKRLWILCLVMFMAFVISNALWIYYESQWEVIDTTTTAEATQDGDINIVGGGDVNYGTESKDN